MSNGVSAAVSALNYETYQGTVSVYDMNPRGMITVRGDLSDATLTAAIQAHIGLPVPGVRKIEIKDDRSVIWMSPDELLILCAYGEAQQVTDALRDALVDTHALAVNVSDARALIGLQGVDFRNVLAKVTPADVSEKAFGVGDVRRSRLAQVAGAFWVAEDDTVQIVCFRSVARYVFDLLKFSAKPGSEVDYF